jgi:uridine kinase
MRQDQPIALLAETVLVETIVERKRKDRPLKVAIDGRSASGKSTLADKLASALREKGFPVLRPSLDGFHHAKQHRYRQGEYSAIGYYEDAFDYQAVIDDLLGPLSGDDFPVLCRQVVHDVRTNLPDAAPPVSAGADSILLFDGIFVLRRELNAFWDLRILLDVNAAASLSRALRRDTGVIGQEEMVQRKYALRYEPAWQIYIERERPESKADVIVDNRDFANAQILKP